MNSSQLLYKISNLQYNIRMKEVEYIKALNAGDEFDINLKNAALTLLKEDLALSIESFNSLPAHSFNNSSKDSKKPRWWQSFFNLRASFNKKY